MRAQNEEDYNELWESIRSNWVNGNCTDAVDSLTTCSTLDALLTVRSAVIDYYRSTGNHTSNGALQDLIGILNAVLRRSL